MAAHKRLIKDSPDKISFAAMEVVEPVSALEIETKEEVLPRSELLQFFEDYWLEAKRYNTVLALLTAWGVFEEPPNFVSKRRFRLVELVIEVMFVVGMTVVFTCAGISEGAVAIIVLILATIPIEILNVIWFRVVRTNREVKRHSEKHGTVGKCGLWSVQYLGKFVGGLYALALFIVSLVFFIFAVATSHSDCSKRRRDAIIGDILLFEFLLVPVLMSLPYWRGQSILLSFMGQLGPVVGLVMHVRQYGFHPAPRTPPCSPVATNESGSSRETNAFQDIVEPASEDKV